MYEHPYLTYQASAVETERLAQAAERRRIIAENPSRVVARDGFVTRMLRRALSARMRRAEASCPAGARCVAAEA
ncbi:hypothetical protein AB0N59_02900 [Microbacterium sp. NPDC089321]|uniref:hypothetical protein n=1 Tax=Microbacterium sp. NPDC089321 TaxID=3155183 RepID=UPI0034171D5C